MATRRILIEEGAGADIYSFGELHAALQAGVDPEIISVNGGGKQEDLIEKCIRSGVRITVEDLDEPELIDRVASRLGTDLWWFSTGAVYTLKRNMELGLAYTYGLSVDKTIGKADANINGIEGSFDESSFSSLSVSFIYRF